MTSASQDFSDAATVSFIIQKNLGTFGDGGAVVTNNSEVDRVVRKLRNHGSEKRSCHTPGYNSRLDDLHAGVLSAKLKHTHDWSDLRRKWAARYSTGLAKAAHIMANSALAAWAGKLGLDYPQAAFRIDGKWHASERDALVLAAGNPLDAARMVLVYAGNDALRTVKSVETGPQQAQYVLLEDGKPHAAFLKRP